MKKFFTWDVTVALICLIAGGVLSAMCNDWFAAYLTIPLIIALLTIRMLQISRDYWFDCHKELFNVYLNEVKVRIHYTTEYYEVKLAKRKLYLADLKRQIRRKKHFDRLRKAGEGDLR